MESTNANAAAVGRSPLAARWLQMRQLQRLTNGRLTDASGRNTNWQFRRLFSARTSSQLSITYTAEAQLCAVETHRQLIHWRLRRRETTSSPSACQVIHTARGFYELREAAPLAPRTASHELPPTSCSALSPHPSSFSSSA